MAIYLVQHGKSLSKKTDPDPGLSEKGQHDVRRIAEVASAYNILPIQIRHSGKKRARETAEIFKKALIFMTLQQNLSIACK